MKKLTNARGKIAKLASTFITDGSVRLLLVFCTREPTSLFYTVFSEGYYFQKILVHSKSRVVLKAMEHAATVHKHFQVFVTNSSLDNSG